MSYRDLGPGDDHELEELTPSGQCERDDETNTFVFPIADEQPQARSGWVGPLAVAGLLAIAIAAGWSITRDGAVTAGSQASTPVTTDAASSPAPAITTPPSTPTSTIPPPPPIPTATTGDATTPPIDPALKLASEKFIRTWGQRNLSTAAWGQQVRPLCDERGWFLIEGTDPANVPAFTLNGEPILTQDGKEVQVSVPTTAGNALITFVRSKEGGRFLMHNFTAPGGMS